MNYQTELARIRAELARSQGQLEGGLEALANSPELEEVLRVQAWLQVDRKRVKGTSWASMQCPPGWPVGRSLDAALETVLGPLRAKIKAGGGQPVELGDPHVKRFREALGK